ncbi:hypothetical protein RJ639_043096 [Escallonia herrerae]|uniref:Uncharacterized protein n=1 Tax=Escallonia herrerae TaxID=1293975 RepID=A0AA88W8P2_9ASTE|nr:hypothetical protein RJ639_043096 [Escallonia herrerae]
MDRANSFKLTLLVLFLVLNPKMECQLVRMPPLSPRPLCVSQFALVNHACSLLPFTPVPPPSPPSPPPPSPPSPPCSSDCPPGPEHGHRHRQHGHGHRHGGHRHEHAETPVEADCCRWLNSVDDECVCDLLVYLPPFLSKPIHQYTVTVDSSCNVTFQCSSRLRV